MHFVEILEQIGKEAKVRRAGLALAAHIRNCHVATQLALQCHSLLRLASFYPMESP